MINFRDILGALLVVGFMGATGLLFWRLKWLPDRAAPNLINEAQGNAVARSQHLRVAALLRHGLNLGDNGLRQLSLRVAASSGHLVPMNARTASISPRGSAVAHTIIGVFPMRRPIDILRRVVTGVAVLVRRFVLVARGWPVEGGAKKVVDRLALTRAATLQHNLEVPVRASHRRQDQPGKISHPPKVGNRVMRGAVDCAPLLGSVIGISHRALLSRGGQGRALLKQRFRPVFYSRFLSEKEAA